MKTALITGASSGIGFELAKIFATQKFQLVLVARRKEKLEKLKIELEKIGAKVYLVIADLSKKDSPEKIKSILDKEKIKIDVLVNNAGFGDYSEFQKADLKKIEDMIFVNVLALTKLTHLFLNEIIESEGKILNVASVAAFIPGPNMAAYYATKAYVLSLGEGLSGELKDKNVTVTTLCPGPVSTEFAKVAEVKSKKMFAGNIPSAKEVAEFGYKELMKGKTTTIHGFKYKVMIYLTKIIPRNTVIKLVKKMI